MSGGSQEGLSGRLCVVSLSRSIKMDDLFGMGVLEGIQVANLYVVKK